LDSKDNEDNDSNQELHSLKQILNNKIKEKKNQIHPLHDKVYNDKLEIEIRSLRWVLEQLTRQRQINHVRWLVEKEINNLGIKMKNSIDMVEKDVLITEVEILLSIVYIIQDMEEEKAEASNKLII
jgi:hypothetical protein